MNKKLLVLSLVVAFILAFSVSAFATDVPISDVNDPLFLERMENNKRLSPNWIGTDAQGLPTTMPVFQYSTGVINEIVWVEVPCDTDRDGKRDRISLWIRRPNVPAGFLCPAVMEFSPYHNGTIGYTRLSSQINSSDLHVLGMAQTFTYKDNSAVHLEINPDTTHLTYDDIRYKGVEAWDPIWWSTKGAFSTGSWYTGTDYTDIITFTDEYGNVRQRKNYTGSVPPATVPGNDPGSPTTFTGSNPWSGSQGWPARWNHYLVRGYAGIYGQLLGNRAVEGITNSLHVEEWISAAAACAWLNGEATAFTTRYGNIEVKADWALGFVALDGTSYPGTTPTAAAMSGVSAVKAIMPSCHVASWYEYYRSGGALHGPESYGGEDMNIHSSFNFSRINSDSTSGIPPATGALFPKTPAQEAYVETQFYMMEQQDRVTADYNAAWDFRNLTRAYGKFAADVGILETNGQQDWNVMPRHAYQALQAWRDKFGGTHKIMSSLSKHAAQTSRLVQGKDGVNRGIGKWYLMFLDHFLLGLDNHVDELMYDVNIANSQTGVMEGYDFDNDVEERGTIIPGTHYQTIFLTEGPDGKAGRLSYFPPAATVNKFTDMTMAQQINAAQHQGAPSRPTTTFSRNSGQGNYTPTTAQINYCDDRVVGVNRTTTSYGTYGSLINAVDRPVDGRLMYLSDPLEEDLLLSGTPVVHLNAAPTKGTGNLTVALMEIGRLPRAAVRIEGVSLSSSGATSVTVFPSENGAGSESASSYGRATSGGGTTGYPSRARVGTSVGNFKYVTWGHTDIQNPSYDGKAWFDVPEQNYTPNYYFQTTLIEPGKYYDYVVELNPYNYVFEAGTRIGVMVYGTDVMASPQLDAASVCGLDVKLGDGTYIDLPLKINEPSEPVTVEVESTLVAPSDTVEITYSVKDNAYGFAAFDFDLPFDDSIYTPLTVTPAGLLSGETVAYEIVGSSLNVNYSDIDNVVGEGALFTVTYEVLNDVNYNFDAPLNVNVNAFQYGSIIDKLVDVEVIVKAGALIPYSYRVYMEAADTILSPEDTFYVDVLVGGGLNYTQVAAEIAYDTSLFDYVGYEYLDGWVAAVSAVAPNKVSIRSMPSSNMVVGAPSWPPVKVATLKFSPKDNYEGNIATAEFGFASLFVAPAGTVKAYTTAPGKPINLTLDKNQLSKEEAAFLDLLEYDYVDDLAYRLQHEVGNRYTTSPRSALAVDWIVAELEAYGYTPEVKTFNATGTTTMDGIIWINGKHYVYYGTGTVSNSVYKYNNAAELKISGVEVIHWANQSTALTVPAGDYAGKAVFVTLDTVGTAVAATMPSATNAYNVALALQDAGAAAVMFQTPPMAASGNTTYGRLANQGSGTAITIPVGTVLNYETAPMLSSWDKDTELVLNMRLGTVCKNVIATIPSATGSKKTVYITSHHDTTTSGPGINDNGSGVVMCLGMAKALKNVKFDYNVVFVIFDSEETGGMRGATNFVNSMTAEDRANFEADYNMDMIATSQANCQWMFMNISDTRLNGISTPDVNTSLADNPVALAIAKEYDFYNKTMRAAEKMKFADHVLFAYDTTTDHIVFFRAGMTNSVEYDWRSNRRGSGFETLYHKTGDTYEMNWSLERCQIQADIISLAIFYSAKGHVLPGTVSAPGIITPPVLSPVWQPALITEVWEVEEDFEVLAEDVVDIFGEAIGEKIVIIE